MYQSEQGFRYLNKFNSNILINIQDKIKLLPGFFWFNKTELTALIKERNILNMDTISVFSSFIKKSKIDIPINSIEKINSLIDIFDKKFFIRRKIIPIKNLKDWKISKNKISHKNEKHFSIIGVNVKTNKREVKEWSQPLIEGKKLAMAGFLLKKINNTNHYLCRYILKSGLNQSAITCTVNTSDIKNYKKNKILTDFQKKLIKNFLKKKNKNEIIYDNIISDEGGRFFHCEIRNIAILLKENINLKLPETYFWLSQNQMINMIKDKRIDIEARLLFGCINIKNLI
jgi:oxidase EvaA